MNGFSFASSFPWVFGLILLVALVFSAWTMRRPYAPSMRCLSVTLRTLAALCLLLALANPRRTATVSVGGSALFLLDRSDSIRPEEYAKAAEYIQTVVARKTEDTVVGLLSFADAPVVTVPLSTDFSMRQTPSPARKDATDIAGALEAGLGLLPPERRSVMVLFSDGNETSGAAMAMAAAIRDQGIVTHTVPLARHQENLWGVQKLFAPARVRAGERFRLRALLANPSDTPVRVRLVARRDGSTIKDASGALLHPGTTPVAIDYLLHDQGLHAFDLSVEYETGQIMRAAPVFVEVSGMPRLLIVSPDEEAGRFFKEIFLWRNFLPETARALPYRLDRLLEYDGVVLNEVSPDLLTEADVARLQSYVQDFGGGLIALGAGLEAFSGASFEKMLPVALAQRHTLDKKRRDFLLMLIIDRSGSMDGEKMDMARAAAIRAVEGLEPGDSIGILAFDDASHTVVDLTVLEKDRSAIIEKIRRLTPGGGTDARTALVEAFRIFSSKRIQIRKHLILMTDGITTERQLLDITRRVTEKEVTISTIAIGEDANIPILQQMRQIGGGAFHLITTPSELPRIVVGDMGEQVKEADNIQERFVPELFHPSPMTSGIRADDLPSLRGYVASTLKTAAIKPLMTNFRNAEDPILAHWQYGLGRSAVLMTGISGSWSDEWLRWRNFGRLWEQIARWTVRPRSARDYAFDLYHDGSRMHIRAEAYPAPGGVRALQGTLLLPGDRRMAVALQRTGDALFEGALAVTDTGAAYLSLVEEGRDGHTAWSGSVYLPGTGAFSESASTEKDGRPANYRLLQDIASTTGGLYNPGPDQILPPAEKGMSTRSYRNALLVLALTALLIDIAVHRLEGAKEAFLHRFRLLWRRIIRWIRHRMIG